MCCITTGIPHHNGCICDLEHRPHFHRRFLSKDERIARLTEYKKELSKELKQIEARIAGIKKSNETRVF